MRNFIIVTDGASDLTPAYLAAHRVEVVPLYYRFASAIANAYPNAAAFDEKAFYDALRAGSVVKTAAPSIADFQRVLMPHARAGRSVLYVGFSAKLSGTFNVGRLAMLELQEQFPQQKFLCLNGLGGSLGQGLLLDALIRMRERGCGLEETFAAGEQLAGRMQHVFVVSDLMHLKRGGRIGGSTAVLGTMLQIMPMLCANDEGSLEIIGKVRGRRASLKALAEKVGAEMEPGSIAAVSHGDCEADAMYVRDILRRKYGVKTVWIQPIGPVLGAHCGPGVVAAFYLKRD